MGVYFNSKKDNQGLKHHQDVLSRRQRRRFIKNFIDD